MLKPCAGRSCPAGGVSLGPISVVAVFVPEVSRISTKEQSPCRRLLRFEQGIQVSFASVVFANFGSAKGMPRRSCKRLAEMGVGTSRAIHFTYRLMRQVTWFAGRVCDPARGWSGHHAGATPGPIGYSAATAILSR